GGTTSQTKSMAQRRGAPRSMSTTGTMHSQLAPLLQLFLACVTTRRLTTQLSDGAPASQHAGAPALGCALGSAARGRALYANRRSLQRRVRRRCAPVMAPQLERR